MDRGKEKISSAQVMFMLLAFIMGSFLLTRFIDSLAGQDAWLVIITAFVVSIPFVFCYIVLAKWFPGKSLMEMSDVIYGPVLGKAVSFLYVTYFFHLFSINLMTFKEFYAGFVLPDMPGIVILAVFTAVCAFAVYQGIETIARMSLVAVVVSVSVVFITLLLLIGHMDLTNFQPVLEISPKDLVHSTHIFSSISFCEIVAFLMVFSAVSSRTRGKMGKHAMTGFAVAALVLFIVVVRNIAVLGLSSDIWTNTSYTAATLVNIGQVLTRIDILIAISITVALFIKVCIFYYASVQSISQLFRMRSYSSLLMPLGIIAAVIGLIFFDSSVEDYNSSVYYHPFYTIPFEYFIPLLSVIVARIRRLPKRTAPKES